MLIIYITSKWLVIIISYSFYDIISLLYYNAFIIIIIYIQWLWFVQ